MTWIGRAITLEISRISTTTSIAVGTVITDRPPHRSVRAELPHTAPTADKDERTSRWDKDAGFSVSEAIVGSAVRTCPKSTGGHAANAVAVHDTREPGELSG